MKNGIFFYIKPIFVSHHKDYVQETRYEEAIEWLNGKPGEGNFSKDVPELAKEIWRFHNVFEDYQESIEKITKNQKTLPVVELTRLLIGIRHVMCLEDYALNCFMLFVRTMLLEKYADEESDVYRFVYLLMGLLEIK